jgi:hypothetical protein
MPVNCTVETTMPPLFRPPLGCGICDSERIRRPCMVTRANFMTFSCIWRDSEQEENEVLDAS